MHAVHSLGEHVFSIFPAGEEDPVAATERRREPVERAYRLGIEALLAAWHSQLQGLNAPLLRPQPEALLAAELEAARP